MTVPKVQEVLAYNCAYIPSDKEACIPAPDIFFQPVTEPIVSPFPSAPSDSLSFSASLVDILSHLEVSDVSNCKLVSRRFYNAIKRNQRQMPRNRAYITISKKKKKKERGDTESLSVLLRIKNKNRRPRTAKFVVMNDRIVLDHCQMNGITDLYKVFQFNKKCLAYETSSIEEGLCLVLKPLFCRYLCDLTLFQSSSKRDGAEKNLSTTVCNLFRETRSLCESLTLRIRPDTITILSSFTRGMPSLHLRAKDVEDLGYTFTAIFMLKGIQKVDVQLRNSNTDMASKIGEIITISSGMASRQVQYPSSNDLSRRRWHLAG